VEEHPVTNLKFTVSSFLICKEFHLSLCFLQVLFEEGEDEFATSEFLFYGLYAGGAVFKGQESWRWIPINGFKGADIGGSMDGGVV
jgi:hypothetical protein